ncbi:hypothetical protein ACLOJK_017885 [Asimina triloba]
MELSLSGNSLKTFNRSVTCLARVGNELVIQASPAQTQNLQLLNSILVGFDMEHLVSVLVLEFALEEAFWLWHVTPPNMTILVLHTLNSSRSAYQSVTLKADFFDVYNLSAPQAVCSILRTPISSIDRLCVLLPSTDAAKLQWNLECHNGMRKGYWISCNVEPDIQHLSLDRTKFPSNFVVRPRDFNRLLANFQSSLQEITIISTEPISSSSDSGNAIGGKAVELRSYIDPTKDNSDAALHTQLWIDPSEEFLQYTHTADAVDVTFGVKELKGSEVDVHLFFEKAGEPILMAPKFGLVDGANSDFDTTMVLATMLISQLREGNPSEPLQGDPIPCGEDDHGTGSAAKSSGEVEERRVPMDGSRNAGEQNDVQRLNMKGLSRTLPGKESAPDLSQQPMEADHLEKTHDREELNGNGWSQRHPSNWVSAGDDEEEEDEEELCVQSTPQF